MTKFRNFILGVLAISLVGSIALFAGCGSNGNDNTGDNGGNEQNGGDEGNTGTGTSYVFEAEYTYLMDLNGFGPSGSPTGLGLALEANDASNGWCVANIGPESPITFKITSSEQVTVTLRGVFGSNSLGGTPLKWNPDTFEVVVNGVEIEYNEFETSQSTSSVQNFKTVNLGEITLNEGENTIVFRTGENKYLNNLATAPSIDCIKITTEATLTMEAYEDNV